jgi:hypothetical protein
VQRIEHGPAAADVETKPIGVADIEGVMKVLEFGDGTRALAGPKGGKLRLVFLPKGGALEPPIDTAANAEPASGAFASRDDRRAHGYIDDTLTVYEISATPRNVKAIGRVTPLPGSVSLEWNRSRKRWVVRQGAHEETIEPAP